MNIKPDDDELKKQIESAREKYQPNIIKYLMIAEAPPNSIDRFFYYEDVKKHDYLFLGIMNSLYPELKNKYLASNRNSNIKKQLLQKFQDDGFYLIDLSDLPLSLQTYPLNSLIPNLLNKLNKLIRRDTFIIPIKSNVYNIVSIPILNSGYINFINISIPFPGQGWQNVFQLRFNDALKLAGYL